MKKICAEFLGSIFLVTAVISSVILFADVFESGMSIAVIANALAVAFTLCALIEIFGPVSGAHFNPAVTLVMMLERKLAAGQAALFILAQMAGGVAGAILSHVMFWEQTGGLIFVAQIERRAYAGEIAGTFILVLAVLLLAKSSRAPIIIGLLVGGQIMATSSTMFANPQVTAARMLTASATGIRPFNGLIYIIMQLIGAMLAYAIYKLVFAEKRAKK